MDRGIDPTDLTSDQHLSRKWWVMLKAAGKEYLVSVHWDRSEAETEAAGNPALIVRENRSAPDYS